MSGPAKLTSIEAVSLLAAALRHFAEEAFATLADLELEISRANQWVQHDQKDYWTQEHRRAQEHVSEARILLERKQLFTVADRKPSCDEERKALERARRRYRQAEEKLEAVHHWSRVLDRELIEFRAAINQLGNWLQSDLPQGLANLDRAATALDQYVAIHAPAIGQSNAAISSLVEQALAAFPGGVGTPVEDAPADEQPATDDDSNDLDASAPPQETAP